MPQVQFLNRIVDVRVVTQRQIPVQRVQKNIEFPHVQHLHKMVDVPVVQVQKAVEIPQSEIVQQHVEVTEIQTSESLKSTHDRQSGAD